MYRTITKFITITTYLVIMFIISTIASVAYPDQQKPIASPPSNAIKGGKIVNKPMLWAAAIYKVKSRAINKKPPICTGIFISNYYVLTAAHCTANTKGGLPSNYITSTFIKPSQVIAPESYIYYQYSDVALLKLSEPFKGIKPIALFHGYYINKYQSSRELLTAFGYGLLDKGVYNTNRDLYYIYHEPDSLAYDTDLMDSKPINIGQSIMKGDSGGPDTYNYDFKGVVYNKLVAVHSGSISTGKSSLFSSTTLNPSILQWIAKETGRIIFKSPIDNGYIPLENNAISISGWGKFPTSGKIVIYNDSDPNIVAQCNNVTLVNEQWSCQAKFNNNYKFENYLNYQANVISPNGDILDFVNFKIKRSAIDLKILHPASNFVYHSPENYTYLISGTGTPGKHISSHLVDLVSREIYFNPCIPDGQPLINPYGVWECRIKVLNNKATAYKFTVRYLESFMIQDPKLPKDILDTVNYSIDPIQTIPTMIIESPQANSIDYITKINVKFGLKGVNKVLLYNFYEKMARFVSTYSSTQKAKVESKITSSNTAYNFISQLNPNTFGAYVFIDNDNQPIASNKVDYFIATPLLELTSLTNDTTIKLGENIPITGKAFYYVTPNKPVATNIGTVRVSVNNKDIAGSINFGCEESIPLNPDGTWSCPNPLVVRDAGKYSIDFKLYELFLDNNYLLYESSITITIKSIESVEITSVSPAKASSQYTILQ